MYDQLRSGSRRSNTSQSGDIWYPVEVLSPPVDKDYLSLSSYVNFKRKAMQF